VYEGVVWCIADIEVSVRVAALADYSEGPGRFKDYASKPKPNGYQSVYLAINPLPSRY
jgi:ppGpp synthetase/RelA/SpoT-type nucleotidyltranferase